MISQHIKWDACRYKWIKPDDSRERLAVKELDSISGCDLAVQETHIMEAVQVKGSPLPCYKLNGAASPSLSAIISNEVHNGFLVIG